MEKYLRCSGTWQHTWQDPYDNSAPATRSCSRSRSPRRRTLSSDDEPLATLATRAGARGSHGDDSHEENTQVQGDARGSHEEDSQVQGVAGDNGASIVYGFDAHAQDPPDVSLHIAS